jgi:hypothetical protein
MRSPRRSDWRGTGSRRPHPHDPAAFEAVVATLPLGSVGFERDLTDKGEKR